MNKHGESTAPFVFFGDFWKTESANQNVLQEIGQYVLRLWCEYYQEWIHVKVDSFVPIDLNGGAAYEGKPGFIESM